MTTNFKIFDENSVNIQSNAEYDGDDYRLNGAVEGLAPSSKHNRLYHQLSVMTAALGEFLSNSGENVSDDDYAALVISMETVWALRNVRTGTARLTLQPAPESGWVFAFGTIGSVASNATNRANADTLALFTLIWENTDASIVTIYNSSGAPTTRGGSAAADFAANKAISLDARGQALAVRDNLGGSAANVITGSSLNGGNAQYLMGKAGAQTHTLVANQIPTTLTGTTSSDGSHTHTGTATSSGSGHNHNTPCASNWNAVGSTPGLVKSNNASTEPIPSSGSGHTHTLSVNSGGSHDHDVTVTNNGGGQAHNNLQPTMFWNLEVKL